VRRCGGEEVVLRPAVVSTSMYRLRECRGRQEEGKYRGGPLLEGEEDEASLSRW
jgi:hypothetical protein